MKILLKEEKEDYQWKFSLIVTEAGILDWDYLNYLFFYCGSLCDTEWQNYLENIEGCCYPIIKNTTNNSFDLIFIDEEYKFKEHLELFLIDNNLEYEEC